MALTLHEYFDIRCGETFDALGNMQALFADVREYVRDEQLAGIVQQQYDDLTEEMRLFAEIIHSPMPEQKRTTKRKKASTEQESAEPLVMVGRTWTGTVGRNTVEYYRVYVTRVPQPVLDVNTAMLAEEVCHFNMGNYTGLIVLAKELGEQQTADRLQTCIDHQTQLRARLEGSLWQILHTQHQHEERKAA